MSTLVVRAAASSPVLRGKQLDYSEKLVLAVAKALGDRRGETPCASTTKTLAQIVVQLFFTIIVEWVNTPEEPLERTTSRRFADLRRVFADASRT